MKNVQRCEWVNNTDALMVTYHDTEWGIPLHKDITLFEFLVLESFQAGLSWRTILHKRKNFKKAFAQFNPIAISQFSKKEISRLLKDKGIVRNKAKIHATINNAKRFLEIKKEFGTFSAYLWGFVHNTPITHQIRKMSDYQSVNTEAILLAKDLKKRGFKFLGPTTVYAYMQATGMVNDHMETCFRKKEIEKIEQYNR
jgi:DNA-3-methyladenine glycosylase I